MAADDVKDVKRASLACALTRIFVLVSEGTEPHLATDVPLRAFDQATEDLRAAALVLDAALVKYARCPPTFRMRAGEAAADIVRFLSVFRNAHVAATDEVVEDIDRFHEIATLVRGRRPPEAHRDRAADRLIVAYKALYFFIRAYQDRLFTALSTVLDPDSRPGHSMERAFAEKKRAVAVRAFLDAELPPYVAWFPEWRTQRNEVKDGVSFSTGGPAPEMGLATVGIRFNEFTPDGGITVDLSHAVQLDDVTHAVNTSASLALAIAAHIPADPGAPASRD